MNGDCEEVDGIVERMSTSSNIIDKNNSYGNKSNPSTFRQMPSSCTNLKTRSHVSYV